MSEHKAAKSAPTSSKSKDKLYRPNLVIGLTGPFGSGCSKMCKVLENDFSFKAFKISEDIRKEVREAGKQIEKGEPGWRKVLQDHGNKKRETDRAYWIKKIMGRTDNAGVIDKDNIVIDGFRNFQEVQEIRKIYPNFFLVAICAEKNERWKRVQEDYKGRQIEFEEDDQRDKHQDFDWGQSVQKCVDDADYVFYNNKSLTVNPQGKISPDVTNIELTLKTQANDFVPLMKKAVNIEEAEEIKVRPPKSEEIQIATAYAQSNSSKCEKRHVGAAITITKKEREFVISAGYNENPNCIKTCLDKGVCLKDANMNSKLTAQCKRIFCPSCGAKHIELTSPWDCSECGVSIKEWLYPNRNMELCTAIHAEERAILSLSGRPAEGGTLYVTTFPCFQCARLVLDAGIKKIVFVEAYPMPETSEFLKEVIDVQPFTGFTARAFFRVFPKVN
jgi:deoxycytidylate deaminase/dephospho-CoA kinase